MTASRTVLASRAGMSTRLPICAPIATKAASKAPAFLSSSEVLDLVVRG